MEVILMMHTAVGWHIEMEFMEDGRHTRAVAMVRLPDGSEVRGHGHPAGTGSTPNSHGSARRWRAPGP
ncbi:hypothetical protein GCM10010220_34170 [Streptomyces parvulus]|nr:hypothetical protein GCM10010220_34170 [Streptomyces parvulus]